MRGLCALTITELRLFLRNPTSVFMALLLPSALLLLQGFVIPGTRVPIGGDDPSTATLRAIDFFVPISITVALLSVAITNYPSAIAGYRQSGVLRRLDVTPIGSHRILLAQWTVSAASLAGAIVIACLCARIAFGAALPQSIPLTIVVIALGTLTMMAAGSLIAATAADAQVAYGVGMLVFMVSLFTAGMWTPGPLMPAPVRIISGYTPLGAMTQALTSAWYGGTVTVAPILVMTGWTLVCAVVSLKVFRWR